VLTSAVSRLGPADVVPRIATSNPQLPIDNLHNNSFHSSSARQQRVAHTMTSRLVLCLGDLFIPDRANASPPSPPPLHLQLTTSTGHTRKGTPTLSLPPDISGL
jgi:hypothetical protein